MGDLSPQFTIPQNMNFLLPKLRTITSTLKGKNILNFFY